MTVELPGLTVQVAAPPAALPPPLRTDVAGLPRRHPARPGRHAGAGRGPDRVPRRVRRPGPGRLDQLRRPAVTSTTAATWPGSSGWPAPGHRAAPEWDVADLAGFSASAYQVVASSPGTWAEGGQVTIWYRSGSLDGLARGGRPRGGPRRAGRGVHQDPGGPGGRADWRPRGSSGWCPPGAAAAGPAGPPRRYSVSELVLTGGTDAAPDVGDYLAAVDALADQPEVAIVAAPDLGGHLTDDADRQDVVSALLSTAADRLDRLVLLDVPADRADSRPDALAWATTMLPGRPGPAARRGGLLPGAAGAGPARRADRAAARHPAVRARRRRDQPAGPGTRRLLHPGERRARRGGGPGSPADRARAGSGFRGRAEPAALRAGARPAGLGRAHAGSRPPVRRRTGACCTGWCGRCTGSPIPSSSTSTDPS